jgi:hypothetical protein
MDERIITSIAEKYKSIVPFLNERSKRVWAASEAKALGRGDVNAVHPAIGIGYLPLKRGFQELENPSFIL